MATAGDFSDSNADDREMIESLRANQGFYECEVFGSGAEEVESEKAWTTCHKTKNQHANFILVSNFSEQNLPDSCKFKRGLVEYIKFVSKLTVKLRVDHVSAARPDGYLFSEAYGENVSHLGTGWVYRVKRQNNRTKNVPSYVTDTSKDITFWWEVEIFTACHVVYDKQEALRTRVDLFYNDESSLVSRMYCYDVKDNDPRNDVCVLRCFTSDVTLGMILDHLYKQYQTVSKQHLRCDPSLCVIISHPHGGHKRITVGELKGDAKHGLRQSLLTEYMKTYTTETCNGSSGAPVIIFPGWNARDSEAVWPGAGPHSWGHVHKNLNQCAAGAFYVIGEEYEKINDLSELSEVEQRERIVLAKALQVEQRKRMVSLKALQAKFREMDYWISPIQDVDIEMINSLRANQGFHECEVFGSETEEVESDMAWTTCKKTKNKHANFIPVSDFSEQNLPDSCKFKTCLAEYIKAVSDLTVKLRVDHVSAKRPVVYPFSGVRGKDVRHLGTGWVYRVTEKSKDTTVWWEIEIFTACHVVYDKQEALETSVDLFYDDESSQVTSLFCYDVRDNNRRNDVCVLRCFTYDVHLGVTLEHLYKYYQIFSKLVKLCWDPSLCVIISHPHGGPKKITVGELKGKAEYDPEQSLLIEYMKTYTTETCNGSSGAPVLTFPGWTAKDSEAVWPGAGPHSWGHVHEKLNQCAAGAFYVIGAEYEKINDLSEPSEGEDSEMSETSESSEGEDSDMNETSESSEAEYREWFDRIRQRRAEHREMDDWIRQRQVQQRKALVTARLDEQRKMLKSPRARQD